MVYSACIRGQHPQILPSASKGSWTGSPSSNTRKTPKKLKIGKAPAIDDIVPKA